MTSLPKIKGIYKRNFSLSKLTWFQTGGKAEVLFIPKDLLDLQFFLKNINGLMKHLTPHLLQLLKLIHSLGIYD